MSPSIGRIVHFTSNSDRHGKYPRKPYAAIITDVREDGSIDLAVFKQGTIEHLDNVHLMAAPERGCAHWPPRT